MAKKPNVPPLASPVNSGDSDDRTPELASEMVRQLLLESAKLRSSPGDAGTRKAVDAMIAGALVDYLQQKAIDDSTDVTTVRENWQFLIHKMR